MEETRHTAQRIPDPDTKEQPLCYISTTYGPFGEVTETQGKVKWHATLAA